MIVGQAKFHSVDKECIISTCPKQWGPTFSSIHGPQMLVSTYLLTNASYRLENFLRYYQPKISFHLVNVNI